MPKRPPSAKPPKNAPSRAAAHAEGAGRSRPVGVVIGDCQPLFSQGLCLAFGADSRFRMLGVATTANETSQLVQLHTPQVVVLDIDMGGGGSEVVARVRSASPATGIPC